MNATELFPIDPRALDALHDRVVEAARRDGLLDVAYRTVDTPVGPAARSDGCRAGAGRLRARGLRRGARHPRRAAEPRILRSPARLDDAARQLDEYFAGHRRAFDLRLDHALSAGFRRTVQGWLPDIAYGHTATYGEVAAAVGNQRPSARWAAHAPPTRCRWSCRAIACFAATAASAATWADRKPRPHC